MKIQKGAFGVSAPLRLQTEKGLRKEVVARAALLLSFSQGRLGCREIFLTPFPSPLPSPCLSFFFRN